MAKIQQSTAVALTDDRNNLPAAPAARKDPFDIFADAVAPENIVGELLRFSKGDFFAGRDADVVPAGSKFTANLDLLLAGFVKWRNNRPVAHALVRVADGEPLPRRQDLGDDDRDEWEIGLDGKARDPWQEVNYLPLMDEDGNLFTFVVSGKAPIREAGALSRAYARHRKTRPHEFPRVTLNVGSYPHRDRSIGRVKFAEINIIGWTTKTEFVKALAAAGLVPDDAVTTAPTTDDGDGRPEPPPYTEFPDDPDDVEF